MAINQLKIAQRIASNYLMAYEAKGDIEKVIGQILTGELGITDAPEELFTMAQGKFVERLDAKELDMDLGDPKVYPLLREAIMETLEELDIEVGEEDPEVSIQ